MSSFGSYESLYRSKADEQALMVPLGRVRRFGKPRIMSNGSFSRTSRLALSSIQIPKSWSGQSTSVKPSKWGAKIFDRNKAHSCDDKARGKSMVRSQISFTASRAVFYSSSSAICWNIDHMSDGEVTFAALEAGCHFLSIVNFESRKP